MTTKLKTNDKHIQTVVTFGDIEIEEITIEDSLDTSCNYGNEVEETLWVIAIDPVENVQRTVAAECKQVVAGNCLSFARFADHKQLWQDCNWLQVDWERPENLQHLTLTYRYMHQQHRQTKHQTQQHHVTACAYKSERNRPLRLLWHNFTNSQRSLIIFDTEKPYSSINSLS